MIPAENSIEFGAAIVISDSQTIARDPLENSMEIWRGDFDFRFPIPMPVGQPGRVPFDLGFDLNLKKN